MRINFKITSIFILFMAIATVSYSQFEFGLKTGINSTDVLSSQIITNENGNQINLTLDNASYGYHIGLYTRISVLGIFIEPNFLFNSSSNAFMLKEFTKDGITSKILNESYHHMDIPLMVGVKAGFFRLQLGPVAHIFIDSKSDLFNISGYEQKFKTASYGIQGGVGLDIWKIRLDLNYEANLSKFADHISIGGQDYVLGDRPARLIASVGMRF